MPRLKALSPICQELHIHNFNPEHCLSIKDILKLKLPYPIKTWDQSWPKNQATLATGSLYLLEHLGITLK